MKDVVCMLPWQSFTVTMKNTIRPCCRFPTQTGVDMHDYEDAFRQLRTDMLAGKKDSRCSKCYEEESSGMPSMRTAANEFHAMEDRYNKLTPDFRNLEHIELSLDNTCNYQCRMCTSMFSSKLLKRDIYLSEAHPHHVRDTNLNFHPAKVAKSRYETLKHLSIDWSSLRSIKLLGGEPFLSPNFLDFLYFLDMKTDISNIQLELVTNCSQKMSEEVAEILNQFKTILLSGSFDGLPELSEYQRVGSDFKSSFMNYLEYGDLLKNRRMTIHQTFTVLNVNKLDASLEHYKPHCDYQSWSYDDYHFSFLQSPDWFEEWVLSQNDNEKLRSIFKKRKYDHIIWHRILRSLRILDTYYTTSLEKVNPELSEILRIKTKKYIDAHEKPATRDCMYCDMIDEM